MGEKVIIDSLPATKFAAMYCEEFLLPRVVDTIAVVATRGEIGMFTVEYLVVPVGADKVDGSLLDVTVVTFIKPRENPFSWAYGA